MDPAPTDPGSKHPPQQADVAATNVSLRLRDRRREKPLLSCTFCRSRKVRCDRQLPCKTCTSRGIGFSCIYRSDVARKNNVSVSDRIQQLELLVRSLVEQQQQQQTPPVSSDGLATESSVHSFQGSPNVSLQGPGGVPPQAAGDEDTLVPGSKHASRSQSNERIGSPAPSEYGSMRRHSHGVNYVGSVHWAAVLDSISELREHYEEEEEARMLASDQMLRPSPGPRLLYEPVQDSKADLLAAIPSRPVVDRMVARYFNAQGVVPEILHRGHFLREYEKFWQEPETASLAWVGLLFSMMCITTQYQQSIEDSDDPETPVRVNLFREKTIHCLILSEYTRGGDYVLETLVNYLTSEMFLSNDGEIGLWLVQGMLVQLALSLGYHRDPQKFANITPFAGEMRRRMWAVIVQLDLRLSSQMALPRVLKLQHYDTAEPRNLLDTDFDEATTDLPPSRPETEVTPILYSLAKSRIDQMNGLVSDLVNDTGERPYSEILELNRKLQEAEASLPPNFRWQPLSQSLMVPPQIVMHRVLLQLAIQRQTIWLHRKYLTPAYSQAQYESSRSVCVQAAIKILEFQQIVDEETQRDGLLYPVRWMFMSSRPQAVFLLGISILCYYIQLTKTRPDVALDAETGLKIHNHLRSTYPLWLRSSAVSREAQRVVEHLGPLLGLRGQPEPSLDGVTTNPSHVYPPQGSLITLDQLDWDTYEAYMANFPTVATSGTEFLYPDMPGSSTTGVSMADLLMTNPVNLDRSMDGENKSSKME